MDPNDRQHLKNVVERLVEKTEDLQIELSTETPVGSPRIEQLASAIRDQASEAQEAVERSPERPGREESDLRDRVRDLGEHVGSLMGVLPGDNPTTEPRDIIDRTEAIRHVAEEIRSALHEEGSRDTER
jgi:hypothetical protein